MKKPEDVGCRTATGRQRGSMGVDLSNNLYGGMSMPKSYSSMNAPHATIFYFGRARWPVRTRDSAKTCHSASQHPEVVRGGL